MASYSSSEYVERLLSLGQQHNNEPLIRSQAEFHQLELAYLSRKNQQPAATLSLDGLPTNDRERVHLVHLIVDAIKSTSTAYDAYKLGVDGNPPTMKPALEYLHSLSDFELELTAWKLLGSVCIAYQGRYNVPSWSKPALRPELFTSFDDHFTDVLETLRRSKACCKNLFDTQITWMHRLAIQPATELKRKKNEADSNKKRQENIDAAVGNRRSVEPPRQRTGGVGKARYTSASPFSRPAGRSSKVPPLRSMVLSSGRQVLDNSTAQHRQPRLQRPQPPFTPFTFLSPTLPQGPSVKYPAPTAPMLPLEGIDNSTIHHQHASTSMPYNAPAYGLNQGGEQISNANGVPVDFGNFDFGQSVGGFGPLEEFQSDNGTLMQGSADSPSTIDTFTSGSPTEYDQGTPISGSFSMSPHQMSPPLGAQDFPGVTMRQQSAAPTYGTADEVPAALDYDYEQDLADFVVPPESLQSDSRAAPMQDSAVSPSTRAVDTWASTSGSPTEQDQMSPPLGAQDGPVVTMQQHLPAPTPEFAGSPRAAQPTSSMTSSPPQTMAPMQQPVDDEFSTQPLDLDEFLNLPALGDEEFEEMMREFR